MITLLAAVSAINDAIMLQTALQPLVDQARAMGKDVITDDDVKQAALQTGQSLILLRAAIAAATT